MNVKYTCMVHHLFAEKTKRYIYISYVYFQIATFLKTIVYVLVYRYIYLFIDNNDVAKCDCFIYASVLQ